MNAVLSTSVKSVTFFTVVQEGESSVSLLILSQMAANLKNPQRAGKFKVLVCKRPEEVPASQEEELVAVYDSPIRRSGHFSPLLAESIPTVDKPAWVPPAGRAVMICSRETADTTIRECSRQIPAIPKGQYSTFKPHLSRRPRRRKSDAFC